MKMKSSKKVYSKSNIKPNMPNQTTLQGSSSYGTGIGESKHNHPHNSKINLNFCKISSINGNNAIPNDSLKLCGSKQQHTKCKTNKLESTQSNINYSPSNSSIHPLNIDIDFFENDPFESFLEENEQCKRVNDDNFILNSPDKKEGSQTSKYLQSDKEIYSIEEDLEDEFSQFCKNSQNMKQLEDYTIPHEKQSTNRIQQDNFKINTNEVNYFHHIPNNDSILSRAVISNSNSKRKTVENTNENLKIQKLESENKNNSVSKQSKTDCNSVGLDSIDKTHGQDTMQISVEVSQLFENLEKSICNFGPSQHTNSEDENHIEHLLNETIASTNFAKDLLMQRKLNQPTDNISIGDVVKEILMKNAIKHEILSQKLVNRTIFSTKVEFRNLGSFYGLPNKIKELIKQYKGIDNLYDWQDECLKLPAVLNRKNLIYSLPTSGGKTLVAEILILREIICRRHNVIFVLPYVAIVQEKVWALSSFGVALDFLIEEYAAGKGTYPPRKRRHKHSVYIATTEKALSLINSLIELGRLEEIGLVVVDELHLIGDEQRGPVLETLLTKLMYLNGKLNYPLLLIKESWWMWNRSVSTQIIGMSATIGNLTHIQKFLNADVYSRNFRPVELIEYVKCDQQIAKINWRNDTSDILEIVRKVNFSYSDNEIKIDPDHLGGLVMEVIPKESCLIFCPSKKNCENVVLLLCKVLNRKLRDYKSQEKRQLLESLNDEVNTVCDILKYSIPFGIAYHHSGLTSEERRLIEEAYRAGILNVICCTSTLAAGVNLPAKRVIIRKPYIAQDFINLSRYKQMVGRAGRAGLGEFGESILICTKEELPKVRELLVMPMDNTLSKMHESEGINLRSLFLSCIGLGLANTREQLEKVTNMTLLGVQHEQLNVDLRALTKKIISDLIILGAVEIHNDSISNSTFDSSNNISIYLNNADPKDNNNKQSCKDATNINIKKKLVLNSNTKLSVSKLGCAAIKSGLDLCKAHMLYDDLSKAQESLVLIDCLHLLYLVTPYGFIDQIKPSMDYYHHIMMRLTDKERKTASILGINDSCIIRMFSNQSIKNVSERVLKKFYVALMLFDLWNEISVIDVSHKYQVNRGIVQNLITGAATFASNVVTFCEEMSEFWAFAHLLRGMNQKLSYCCCKELLPLMELPAVKQGRAKQLFNAGYKSLQSIAKADPNDLVSIIQFMTYKVAHQLIAAAKLLLLEKVETLREQAEELLTSQTDLPIPV